MTETPCRYCTDRNPYCHGTCQKYIDWKVIHAAEKEAIEKARSKYAMTYAQKKAYWVHRRRNQYIGCTKKFSG